MERMLVFVLIGVAIGVLIAPDKGSVTRARLTDMISDATDDAKDQADNFLGKVKDTADNFQSKL